MTTGHTGIPKRIQTNDAERPVCVGVCEHVFHIVCVLHGCHARGHKTPDVTDQGLLRRTNQPQHGTDDSH